MLLENMRLIAQLLHSFPVFVESSCTQCQPSYSAPINTCVNDIYRECGAPALNQLPTTQPAGFPFVLDAVFPDYTNNQSLFISASENIRVFEWTDDCWGTPGDEFFFKYRCDLSTPPNDFIRVIF